MSPEERDLRQDMAKLCASRFDRGFLVGTASNVSASLPDGILMTPTNSRLGDIGPDRIAEIDFTGTHVSGDNWRSTVSSGAAISRA